ncbi:aminotransferase class III-fold pyridoxal phosphate-dependent enzyme, partial [Pseudomonas aeruginosa]
MYSRPSTSQPVEFSSRSRAENSTVWDVEGREYIDFAGGIAVLNTGHLHPKVIAAVQEQLGKLSHT